MERRDYLELMTGQIRCKKMCPVIAREVEDHIEDQKQAFMAEGMTEEEAEKAAVEEMGDPGGSRSGDGSDPQTEDAMEGNFCNRSDADFKRNVCSFLFETE